MTIFIDDHLPNSPKEPEFQLNAEYNPILFGKKEKGTFCFIFSKRREKEGKTAIEILLKGTEI
jgi:hypothetical protein